MELGEFVRAHRIRLGLTQSDVVRLARSKVLSQSNLSRIETGGQLPTLSQVRALERVLRLSDEDLLDLVRLAPHHPVERGAIPA